MPTIARVAREHDLRPGGLERLGDEPGEALVVADAGDEGDLAGEIDRDHGRKPRAEMTRHSVILACVAQNPTRGISDLRLAGNRGSCYGFRSQTTTLPAAFISSGVIWA